MDAILGCARRGVSCKDALIFCTTFPCHNCAKHIVASGISRVVYIEPYPKSKALEMHEDAINEPDMRDPAKVIFAPFVGVGPRRYVDLFSMSLSQGARMERKAPDRISAREWTRKGAVPRVKAFNASYVERETSAYEDAKVQLDTHGPFVFQRSAEPDSQGRRRRFTDAAD
jgi:hypothetical protein